MTFFWRFVRLAPSGEKLEILGKEPDTKPATRLETPSITQATEYWYQTTTQITSTWPLIHNQQKSSSFWHPANPSESFRLSLCRELEKKVTGDFLDLFAHGKRFWAKGARKSVALCFKHASRVCLKNLVETNHWWKEPCTEYLPPEWKSKHAPVACSAPGKNCLHN